jgi:hypothetical protein
MIDQGMRVSHADLVAIARRHGLTPPPALHTPWTGATGQVFPCGDVVIKIPFDTIPAIEAVTIEAAIGPLVRAMGVEAPELVAFDESRSVLSVPIAIFRRVEHAQSLDRVNGGPASVRAAWEAAGRQLAIVHAIRKPEEFPLVLRSFRQSPELDPRPWVEDFRSSGMLAEDDARWLCSLLDRLALHALADLPLTLCHGDVNAANVLVDGSTLRFRALIDWSGAGWLDPAWDFAAVSLAVVPFLLSGHRSIVPLPDDDTAEARICWCQVQTRMYFAQKTPLGGALIERLKGDIGQIRRFARESGLLYPTVPS